MGRGIWCPHSFHVGVSIGGSPKMAGLFHGTSPSQMVALWRNGNLGVWLGHLATAQTEIQPNIWSNVSIMNSIQIIRYKEGVKYWIDDWDRRWIILNIYKKYILNVRSINIIHTEFNRSEKRKQRWLGLILLATSRMMLVYQISRSSKLLDGW